MNENETYKLGYDTSRQGNPAVLPKDITSDTPQARAFYLGYHDGIRGRVIYTPRR